jgi:hypothetical protein
MDDCPHGQQKRTCEICELAAERDGLRSMVDTYKSVFIETEDRLRAELASVTEERDRLRAVVDAVTAERDRLRTWIAAAANATEATVFEVLAERDRLRAVVDAVRVLVEQPGGWYAADMGTEPYNRLMAALTQLEYSDGDRARVQLDRSAEATDG